MLNSKIIYYLNKEKFVLWLILSLLFEIIGVLVLVKYFDIKNYSNILYQIICIIVVIFLGFVIIRFIMMLLNKKPGIIIDHAGITINSNFIHVGYINWKDINTIKNNNVDVNTRGGKITENYIRIIIKNPKEYIKQQKNLFSKIVFLLYLRIHDSPILIQESALKCNYFELVHVLFEQINEKKYYNN